MIALIRKLKSIAIAMVALSVFVMFTISSCGSIPPVRNQQQSKLKNLQVMSIQAENILHRKERSILQIAPQWNPSEESLKNLQVMSIQAENILHRKERSILQIAPQWNPSIPHLMITAVNILIN
jgi:predicted PurR-regulated permease PerM